MASTKESTKKNENRVIRIDTKKKKDNHGMNFYDWRDLMQARPYYR